MAANRIALVTLGCAKNLVDSEAILAMFPDDFSFSTSLKDADIILINTCGFISSARLEAFATIKEMASYNKAKVIVMGCLLTLNRHLEEEFPFVSLWISLKDYPKMHEMLNELLGRKDILPFSLSRRVYATESFSSYLKISEGCDNRCAFCAIPAIRGRMVSRPIDELVEEAKKLAEMGKKEIILISQDPLRYGEDLGKRMMLDLLKKLEKLPFYSIRLLYLYPEEMDEELLQFIAHSQKIPHYFDIPVQTGSQYIHTRMLRRGSVEETRKLFKHIKELMPDATFRTTLIAGFPGEKEEHHQETLSFISEVGFEHLGVFAYSREKGTRADSYPDQVDEATKERRRKEILALQREISSSLLKKHIGEKMEGIVLSYSGERKLYRLRSYFVSPDDIDGEIYFSSSRAYKEGDIAKIKIDKATTYDLYGHDVTDEQLITFLKDIR